MSIDINCDMGEGMPHDEALMPYISSASIACGYHAGDEKTIRSTIQLCKTHAVAIGAHPGFNDKKNFGRVAVNLNPEALSRLVREQLQIIQNMCTEAGASLYHVKLHGALYNMTSNNREMSKAIAKTVHDFNPTLIYYGLSGSIMLQEAAAIGLKTAHEVFADRTYQDDGSLTSRAEPNALITDVKTSVEQVIQICKENQVTAVSGKVIPVQADTICVHGDGEQALAFAKAIHGRLLLEGIKITTIH